MQFLITDSKTTATYLMNNGYIFINEVNGFYRFVNNKTMKFSECELESITYTNILDL